MSRKLTILMTPLDAIGCFNPCICIAQQLRDRGHNVVFATPDSWKGKLSPQGFTEEYLSQPSEETQLEPIKVVDEVQVWGEIVQKIVPLFLLSPEEQIEVLLIFYKEIFNQTKDINSKLKEIVAKVKPDVIVTDSFFHQPSIMEIGIPWILSASLNPVGISDINVPPAFSGYPNGEEHRHKWENFTVEYKSRVHNFFEEVKDWVSANGGPVLEFSQPYFLRFSPHANIYMCPEELDYTQFRPNPPNFHRFDGLTRNSNESFGIPEVLMDKPGKLIYFSMGTIGCAEVKLMKRIISILTKSPNRFIVSKGPLADTYELPDNMWGAASLPQTKVLPLVDLVITHGGNNTVTESFYFGKPLIVLPLFADQLDNAQRVHETGFGIRFHAYKVTEGELLDAIEKLLGDEELILKMSNISKRIQGANNQSRAADLVERIARNE